MSLVIVAHGTRDPAGAVVASQLAAAVRAKLRGVRVELAFADVRGPTVADVLADLPGPAVVLPAFLAAGYHVRVDLPAQLADFPDATLTAPLGPARAMVAAVHDRLLEAGYRAGDRVVLAAAGSSDPLALADVRRAALRLSARLDAEVHIGYCATAQPALPQAIAQLAGRVSVASWLLAPGLFHRSATRAGADVVSAPIGVHPLVVDLIIARYRATGAAPGIASQPRSAGFPSTG
jgi:sirohydrochlorin ferrochelatase